MIESFFIIYNQMQTDAYEKKQEEMFINDATEISLDRKDS